MLLFAALAVLPQRDDASLSSSALSLKTGQGRSGVCPPIENRHRAKFEKKVLSPGQCTGHSLPRSELLARRADSLSVGTSFDHGRRELKPCHVLSFRKGQRALGVQFSLSLVSRSSTAHDRLSLCLLSLRRWADTPGGRIGEGGVPGVNTGKEDWISTRGVNAGARKNLLLKSTPFRLRKWKRSVDHKGRNLSVKSERVCSVKKQG